MGYWQRSITAFNSLVPGRSSCDFENVIFNLALLICIFKSSSNNMLRWMPQDLTDDINHDKSTLVQVMAWCHQAASHYLNQCWTRAPMPYGVTRPQWVNLIYWLMIKWKHFLHCWLFLRRIHLQPDYSLHKWPFMQYFDVFFVVSLNKLLNSLVNEMLHMWHN